MKKGSKHSKATRDKMSRALSGDKHPMFGKHHSIGTRDKMSKVMSKARTGDRHPNWNGGRTRQRGYILIYTPTHPHKNASSYVYEHRLIMEKHLGRTLLPTEVVHHINNIVGDNRIENLMLCANNSEHRKYHKKEKK